MLKPHFFVEVYSRSGIFMFHLEQTGEAASSVCWPKSTLHFLRPFGFSLGLKLAELWDSSFLKRCFFCYSVHSRFSHWVTFLFSMFNRISIVEFKMAIGQCHRIVILCFFVSSLSNWWVARTTKPVVDWARKFKHIMFINVSNLN